MDRDELVSAHRRVYGGTVTEGVVRWGGRVQSLQEPLRRIHQDEIVWCAHFDLALYDIICADPRDLQTRGVGCNIALTEVLA